MDLQQKILKFKLHILAVLIFILLILSICYVAPRFLDIISFFWPLLASTALFLVAIVVFGQITPVAAESYGEKAGEGLLDYVAREPEHLQSVIEEAEEGVKAH